jgi:hypothetical protein
MKTRPQATCARLEQNCDWRKTTERKPIWLVLDSPQGSLLGMPSREEYLRYAEECIEVARKSADPDTRMRLLEMAQAWRALAQKVEESEPKKEP